MEVADTKTNAKYLTNDELFTHVRSEYLDALGERNLERAKSCVGLLKNVKIENYSGTFSPIILTCQFGVDELLKFILGKDGRDFLKQFKRFQPEDKDPDGKTAFYYVIEHGHISMAEQLINYCSDVPKLGNFLAATMEILELRNVHISEEMEYFIAGKIVAPKFLYKKKKENSKHKKTHMLDSVRLRNRIDFLLKNANILCTEYTNKKPLDRKFFYICQNVAKNIYILKKQLRASYNELPWEEIEFCTIIFYSSNIRINGPYTDVFYRTLLTREKYLRHLLNFSQQLTKKRTTITYSSQLPKINRAAAMETILTKNPEFAELYEDFENIRDLFSLMTISVRIVNVEEMDPDDDYASVVINRVLQTIGECMKNTLDSPNLSSHKTAILQLAIPKNAVETTKRLGNLLSHADSMPVRTEFEKKIDHTAIENLQYDLNKVRIAIYEMILVYLRKVLILILKMFIDCKSLDEYDDICRSIKSIDTTFFVKILNKSEHTQIRCLVGELDNLYEQKSDEESKQFDKINSLLDTAEKEIKLRDEEITTCILILDGASSNGSHSKNSNCVRVLRTKSQMLLKNLQQSEKIVVLKEIAECTEALLKLSNSHCKLATNKALAAEREREVVLWKILRIAEIEPKQIDWLEKLNLDIKLNDIFKLHRSPRNSSNEILLKKFSDLRNVLSRYSVSDEGDSEDSEDIEDSEDNQDSLVDVMVEMILFDILSLLEESNKVRLENNIFCLDTHYPIIVGREFWNLLAHENSLAVILPLSIRTVRLNCDLIMKANEQQFSNSSTGFRLGKLFPDTFESPASVESCFDENIKTISNQQNMFSALTKGESISYIYGYLVGLEGSDINARTLDLEDALHLVAKSGNLKEVKHLKYYYAKANPFRVDFNGQNALHVSASFGHSNLVEYFITTYDLLDVNVPCLSFPPGNKTALHIAAANGHLDTVKMLIKHKANKYLYDKGLSPLALAAINNHIDVVKFLFDDKHSNLKATMMNGFTLLHYVAEYGYPDIVNFFIADHEVDVSCRNENGEIPLLLASINGHLEVVRILLENGSKINVKSMTTGKTPLHYAIEKGHFEIAKLLLKFGANPNITDITNHNAVHVAAVEGCADILKELLREEGNIQARTDSDLQPIHLAARNGHLSSVKLLLESGAHIDSPTSYPGHLGSPLNYAALSGHFNVVQYLIEAGAALNSDKSGNPKSVSGPIRLAAQNGHKTIVEYLFSNGLCIDASEATAALETAIDGDHYELIDLLLDKGAEITDKVLYSACSRCVSMNIFLNKIPNMRFKKTSDGLPLMHIAVVNGSEQVLQLLIKSGCNVNDMANKEPLLRVAVQMSRANIVQILLRHGAEITTEMKLLDIAVTRNSSQIVTILLNDKRIVFTESEINHNLLRAITMGYTSITSSLLKFRGDKNTGNSSEWEANVMCEASLKKKLSILEILVDEGLSVNALSAVGNSLTPILTACQAGNTEVVRFLVSQGADVNCKSVADGSTPLHLAAYMGYDLIIELLLQNKSTEYVLDAKNRFPIEMTVSGDHVDCVKLFIKLKKMNVNARCMFNNSLLLHLAAKEGAIKITRLLVELGADIHAENAMDSKPIHIATRGGHIEIVKFYLKLEKGLDINDRHTNGNTLLHCAALQNNTDMMEFLIYNGADVNLESLDGLTPLMAAISVKAHDAERILRNIGAKLSLYAEGCLEKSLLPETKRLFTAVKTNDFTKLKSLLQNTNASQAINFKNSDNTTVLHVAAWKGYLESVKVILNNGGNPNSIGKNGSSPLHYATKYKHLHVVKELLINGAFHDLKSEKGKTALDYCNDREIQELLTTVEDAFQTVQANEVMIIPTIKNIKNVETQKAVTNACNTDNDTIFALATRSDFPALDDLFGVLDDKKTRKQLEIASRFIEQRRFDEAIEMLSYALEKRIQLFDEESPACMVLQKSIIYCKYKQFKYDEVLASLTEILKLQIRILGQNRFTIETHGFIGLVLQQKGEDEAALEVTEILREQIWNVFRVSHHKFAETQNTVSLIMYRDMDTQMDESDGQN